ncbi:DMT family transporter [Pelagibius litoralis]|uniref:DMT family transporter n=1 Tax=Pelagibius litoralis TaxID=374515 RepID=A0A967EZF4_9PROT|nr:DMT family transporter [Pelagibius litoralis]NIA70240.1 DMT family transporter [Pelagibius litoralis]
MQAPHITSGNWLLIILLALVWGISFFLTEICLRDLGPATLACARVGLAATALLAIAALRGEQMPSTLTDWAPLVCMGLINNALPFSLIMWGQTHIDSGLASILNATTPLFAFVLAHLLTRDERMTLRGALGVSVGFLGAVVLVGPSALTGLGAESWGQAAVLGAALSYAFAGIFGRRLKRFTPLVAAACMTAAATVILLPVALVLEKPWTADPSAETWAALVTLSIVSTAVAYIIYFRVLASAGATNLLLVTFLIPVAAVVLGAVALNEAVTAGALGGMSLIFIGLAVIDGRLGTAFPRLWQRLRRQESNPPNLP